MIKANKIREMLFELQDAGYNQKEIREITNLPQRTQSRIKSKIGHTVRKFTKKRADNILTIEKRFNIPINRVPKNEFKDIINKHTESKYFKKYYQPKITVTKTYKRVFKEQVFSVKDFKNFRVEDLKNIVRNKIYFITVAGKFKNKEGETIPFTYSSEGKKNPNRKQLDNCLEFIKKYSHSGIYSKWSVLDISIITIEKRGKYHV